jgi:hypothetical protein
MRLLEGNASDILRDFAEGHYHIQHQNGKLVLLHNATQEILTVTEEVEFYLELFLLLI